MYRPIFSPAAVSCLANARDPEAFEVDEMASKIWHDVYARTADISWNEVDRTSGLYRRVQMAALVSLGALATLGTELVRPTL